MDKEEKPPFVGYDKNTKRAYVILLGKVEEEIARLEGKKEALIMVMSHLKELLQESKKNPSKEE